MAAVLSSERSFLEEYLIEGAIDPCGRLI